MRIPFRQGVVKHTMPDLVQVSGNMVDLLVVDQPVIITFASGYKDYLYIEKDNVAGAWGPFTPGTDTWLYWDINHRTGLRTFGQTTLAPIVSEGEPSAPQADQHWYDVGTSTMKVWTGVIWQPKIRVFACRLDDNGIPISVSENSSDGIFTGTQVGDDSEIFAGTLLFSAQELPLKTEDGKFITTEDKLRAKLQSTADVKFSGILIEAEAAQNLAKYTIVKFTDFGLIEHADSFTATQRGQFGIIESDTITGQLVNVVTHGVVTNLDWDWTSVGVNQYLYCDSSGVLTPAAAIPQQVPVATIIDVHTIQIGTPTVSLSNVTISAPQEEDDDTLQSTVNVNGTNVGAVSSGGTFNQGISFTQFVQQISTKSIAPTYGAPTLDLNSSPTPSQAEVGTTATVQLTQSYVQGDAGATSGISLKKDGVQISTVVPYTDNNITLGDTANVYQSFVTYAQGACKNNNLGTQDCTGRIVAGTVASDTVTFVGSRKSFFGSLNTTSAPSTSSDIRALVGSSFSTANNATVDTNGLPVAGTVPSFVVTVPAGASQVVFAYPATSRDVASVRYHELDAEVKGLFTKTTIQVTGANGYTPINYKAYTYIPVEQFSQDVHFRVYI